VPEAGMEISFKKNQGWLAWFRLHMRQVQPPFLFILLVRYIYTVEMERDVRVCMRKPENMRWQGKVCVLASPQLLISCLGVFSSRSITWNVCRCRFVWEVLLVTLSRTYSHGVVHGTQGVSVLGLLEEIVQKEYAYRCDLISQIFFS
jgi:hypothetical protein